MATVTKTSAETIAKKLSAWNSKLQVQLSQEGDAVIATCKSMDLGYYEIKQLAELIGEDANITFGRSGPNFRMIIW